MEVSMCFVTAEMWTSYRERTQETRGSGANICSNTDLLSYFEQIT